MNSEDQTPPMQHEEQSPEAAAENITVEEPCDAAPAGPGRPTKRTPEIETAIFECLSLGMSQEQTCDACGVSETLFRNWRRNYPEFAAKVRRAQAEAVRAKLVAIREAADGKNWQAAAWWLERRHPAQWGKSDSLTIGERREVEREDRDGPLTPEQEMAMLQKILNPPYRILMKDFEPKQPGGPS